VLSASGWLASASAGNIFICINLSLQSPYGGSAGATASKTPIANTQDFEVDMDVPTLPSKVPGYDIYIDGYVTNPSFPTSLRPLEEK
jgi:hypothetical protein